MLVRLASNPPAEWTYRSLAAELEVDHAALHRSVERLEEAQLVGADRQPVRAHLEEFLIHALRYSFPAQPGPIGRGVPTAWGVAPLRGMFAGRDDPPPVWPDPHGSTRGALVPPIHENVPRLSQALPLLWEWFSLMDALRLGGARERKLASDELRSRIWKRPVHTQ